MVTLDEFATRLLARIDAGQVDKLVIDLRFNDGGNNILAKSFVQRIAANARINQKGRLFAITGRDTYSAAMNFTSLLEDRTAAIFVGEPAGGAPAHYGDAMMFRLPNSKMAYRVSTLHWDMGVAPSDVREVMEPDLPAAPTSVDFFAGTDAPLAAIARYAEGDRLADRMLARYKAAGMDSAIAMYSAVDRKGLDEVWRSDAQQLTAWAYSVISQAKDRADIFRAFAFVTERFPTSPEAWVARARVHMFVNDTPAVLDAYQHARALRPQNDFIRRGYEAARRR